MFGISGSELKISWNLMDQVWVSRVLVWLPGGSGPQGSLTPVRLSLQTSRPWSVLSGALAPDCLDPLGSHSPVSRVDSQSESAVVSQVIGRVCYLSVADDEERVSSRSLSDDVIAILIVSLKTQGSVWLEDSWCIHRRRWPTTANTNVGQYHVIINM